MCAAFLKNFVVLFALHHIGLGGYVSVFHGVASLVTILLRSVFRILSFFSVPSLQQTNLSEIIDEITMHREFHHPNIVSFLGYQKSEGCLRIFMEQVPGGSLFELLNVSSSSPSSTLHSAAVV